MFRFLAVIRMEVTLFPVELVALHLPQLVVHVARREVLRGYTVTPVDSVGHVEEVSLVAHVLAEGHVGVKKAVGEVRPRGLVEDESAADEVGRIDVRNIPEAFAPILYDLHVVGTSSIVL